MHPSPQSLGDVERAEGARCKLLAKKAFNKFWSHK
jgi:hypothetical protein